MQTRQLHGKSFIGKESISSTAKPFKSFNPRTYESIEPTFYEADPKHVDLAVSKADTAFQVFQKKSPIEVSNFLKEISSELSQQTRQILDRGMLETGYPEARLQGELTRTINQINMFSKLVEEGSYVDAKILKAEGKPDLRRMLIPIGPVGVFGASNFPLAFSVAGGDTISAFAAKCPVVVKGHPAHPGLSEIVGECIVRAAEKSGMPDFVFSLLHGKNEVGEALVKHPKLHAVGFTGSLRAGRALFDLAASREVPIPVYAEMGSVNPLFILPDALNNKTKEIAEGLAGSVTGSMGQLCTKPGLVFTVGHNQEFLDILSKAVSNVAQAPMLTHGIRTAFDSGVSAISEVSGVSLLGKAKSDNKNWGTPTVLLTDASTWKSNPSLHHEIFGPVTLVVTCKTLEEATEISTQLEGQLTASIHATDKDLQVASQLMSNLSNKVGRLIFNGYPTGVEVSSPMTHGGPYPSTSFSNSTSVGTEAIKRWLRPITFQNVPNAALPVELQNENKFKIWRMFNDNFTRDPIN